MTRNVLLCSLHEGGGYAIKLACLSVILSVYLQDYCKSTQLISLKLGIIVGPIDRKNWLTFGGDPLPDTHSGHFSHRCRIGDLLAL